MKVKKLNINSFRGINKLHLEFELDEPTVFVGVNGVGKSSILDCLAILLSWLTGRIQNPKGSGRSFSDEDIRNEKKETNTEIKVLFNNRQEFGWSLSHGRKGKGRENSSELADLRAVVEDIHHQLEQTPQAAIPVVVYYPTNRAVLDIPFKIRTKHSFEQIAAYDEALTGGKIDFRRFFEWFRNREDLENELRLTQSYDYRDRQLEAVRRAITKMLDGFVNLRVQRSPLRMTVEKQGQQLIINQLSDGEKCLLAMVGDLARRLAIANPDPSFDPLQGSGVVLIDEIELHLHPKWQRGIIPDLEITFPNCQFIVTTHSPQVISDVKWIYLLKATDEGVVVEKLRSFGKDSNRILRTLMGTSERRVKIQQDMQELFENIDNGNLDRARQLRLEIAENMGEEDPEFVRADWLIQRQEILNQ